MKSRRLTVERGQENGKNQLAPGARWEGVKGSGATSPRIITASQDGQPIGRSVCSFPRSQANRSTFTNRQDFPTLRAGMIRNHGQGRGRLGLTRRARSGRSWWRSWGQSVRGGNPPGVRRSPQGRTLRAST